MANWRYKLDLKDLHEKARTGKITPPEYCKELAIALRSFSKELMPVDHANLRRIIEDFEVLSKDADLTFDDSDITLESLYDWADCFHTCWIATI